MAPSEPNVHEAVIRAAAGRTSSRASRPSRRRLTAEQSTLKNKIPSARSRSRSGRFQMLGVDRDATPDVVQKAFIQLAKVFGEAVPAYDERDFEFAEEVTAPG